MAVEITFITGNIGLSERTKTRAGNDAFRIDVACDRKSGTKSEKIWYHVWLQGWLVRDFERLERLYTKGRLVFVQGQPWHRVVQATDGSGEWKIQYNIIASTYPELLDYPSHHKS